MLRALVAGTLAVGALTAGCGGQPSPAGQVSAAISAAMSGRSRLAISITASGLGPPSSLTFTGGYDYAAARGELNTGSAIPGQDARYLNQLLYLRFAGGDFIMPPGRSWLEITLDGPAPRPPDPMGWITGSATVLPPDLLATLRGVTGVADLGPGSAGGVSVTRYRGMIALPRLAACRQADQRAACQRLIAAFGPDLPAEIWIDGSGRIRRVSITYALSRPADPSLRFRVVESAEYYDFGLPVRVSAPPPTLTVLPG